MATSQHSLLRVKTLWHRGFLAKPATKPSGPEAFWKVFWQNLAFFLGNWGKTPSKTGKTDPWEARCSVGSNPLDHFVRSLHLHQLVLSQAQPREKLRSCEFLKVQIRKHCLMFKWFKKWLNYGKMTLDGSNGYSIESLGNGRNSSFFLDAQGLQNLRNIITKCQCFRLEAEVCSQLYINSWLPPCLYPEKIPRKLKVPNNEPSAKLSWL